MFVLRLSHSGKAVHVAYANQAQESFLDGHVRAFDALGGVPTGMIRYDNLKPAVIRVLLGRERLENERFVALRSHYGFDSFFCQPGIEGAHEKGGVEGEIGRFRRRHLSPVPQVGSLAALNAAWPRPTLATTPGGSRRGPRPSGQAFARERSLLRPLPGTVFDVAAALSCRVDAKARICVRQSYYSVPARLAGRTGRRAAGRGQPSSSSPGRGGRLPCPVLHKGTEDLRPGPLPGGPGPQARRVGRGDRAGQRPRRPGRSPSAISGSGTPPGTGSGDGAGTRALIGVLLLHRTLPAGGRPRRDGGRAGPGPVDPDLVAVEARQATEARAAPVLPVPGGHAGAGPGTGDADPVRLRRPAHRARSRGRRRRARSRPGRGAGMTATRAPSAAKTAKTSPPPVVLPPVTALTDPAAEAAIGAACRVLHLPTVRERGRTRIAEAAARERLSHRAYLAEVLTAECDDRDIRRRIRRVNEAKFPRPKRLEDLDLTAIAAPCHQRPWPTSPAAPGSTPVNRSSLLGDSGTGKTHLLIGLGTAAAEPGRRVRYVTTAALVNELVEAADDKQLSRVVGRYARLDLLCLDEVGYVHLDPRGAELLFQIITAREETSLDRLRLQRPVLRVGRHLHRPPPGRRRRGPAHLPTPTSSPPAPNSYRLRATREQRGQTIKT